jgi:rubrerythrin
MVITALEWHRKRKKRKTSRAIDRKVVPNKLASWFPHYDPFSVQLSETEIERIKEYQPKESLDETKLRLGLMNITKQPTDLTCIYRCERCGSTFSCRPGPTACAVCKGIYGLTWLNLEEVLPKFVYVDQLKRPVVDSSV